MNLIPGIKLKGKCERNKVPMDFTLKIVLHMVKILTLWIKNLSLILVSTPSAYKLKINAVTLINVISYILTNIHVQANECTIKSWCVKINNSTTSGEQG